MSNQLVCMLPPLACKVFQYILGWQNAEVIKYYPKQYSKFLHLSEQEIDVAVQTLVDNSLLDVSRVDQTWVFTINKDVVNKYYNVSMEKVKEHEGLKLSSNVTWNVLEQQSSKGQAVEVEDMSEEQLKNMLMRIQVMLNEKEQTRKTVKMMSAPAEPKDDLPW